MKKTYCNPKVEIIKLDSQALMAGSLGKGEGKLDASSSDSRGGSLWDDDEE